MASRSLLDLDERLQTRARMHLQKCADVGISLLITCTWRSPLEQLALYAIGRTKPGRKVTWVRNSKHNRLDPRGEAAALAYDVVPMRSGKPVWTTTGDDAKIWEVIGELGESCGLVWGGRWKNPDHCHFELPSE